MARGRRLDLVPGQRGQEDPSPSPGQPQDPQPGATPRGATSPVSRPVRPGAVTQPGEAGEERQEPPPSAHLPCSAMARRLAALLLLLALGCLLGILLLLLGSGDTRGPPGFKVSGRRRAPGAGRRRNRRVLGGGAAVGTAGAGFPVCGIAGVRD